MKKNNTGIDNSGDLNSGNWNSGDLNRGNRNSGDWNSGNWNSGNRNSGFFNTDEPDKVRVFGKWLDMKPTEFLQKHSTYMDIPLNRWINIENMTEEEKKSVKGCTEMGGYLKNLPFKEACQIWWNENQNDHKRFLDIPGFDAAMFKEITGIDTEKKSLSGTKVKVTIDGK